MSTRAALLSAVQLAFLTTEELEIMPAIFQRVRHAAEDATCLSVPDGGDDAGRACTLPGPLVTIPYGDRLRSVVVSCADAEWSHVSRCWSTRQQEAIESPLVCPSIGAGMLGTGD